MLSPSSQIDLYFKLEPNGIKIIDRPTKEVIETLTDLLIELSNATQWYWADLAASVPRVWGSTYNRLVYHSPYEQSTLENYASIAKAIPLQHRHPNLEFGYHQVVCEFAMDLEERKGWLDAAYTQELTVSQLRKEIRKSRGLLPKDPEMDVIELEELRQEVYEERIKKSDLESKIEDAIEVLEEVFDFLIEQGNQDWVLDKVSTALVYLKGE